MSRDVSHLTPREAEVNSAIFEPPVPVERKRAMRIKFRIEAYWRARGYSVDVRIDDDGQVQSNIVNGYPA